MTWLRHAPRHVRQTILDHIETNLSSLGWDDAVSTPFGAPVANLIDAPAISGDQLRKQARAGSVFMSGGDEPAPEDQEMGGPLFLQEHVLFFDVFMDTSAHAIALATDIRDILLGRIGGKKVLSVVNQATGAEQAGWVIHFENVERVSPDQTMSLHWQVVKAFAQVYYPEELY